jgi:signal transduction histidine kinase
LQSLAGTALQVVAARRLLDRDPPRAKDRLEDVQRQLEESELEMRSFIQRLRPPNGASSATTLRMGLSDRLDELRRRVESQWEVRIRVRSSLSEGDLPSVLVDEVYRIVQEGVLNAARHADASIVTVDLSVSDNMLQVGIVDDGSGFPFHGTYDLAALAALNRGPLTLRERVAELHGDLSLRSTEAGTELLITLPVPRLAG